MEILRSDPIRNARRIKRLVLRAGSFEEERILQGLFDVMDMGGSIEIEINQPDGDEVRVLTCSFNGTKSKR